MSVVTSSLMGIIFGCAIVYIVTRLVAVQRRVSYLEEHIVKKADEELVDILSSKIQTIQTSTQTMLSGLAQGIDNVINVPPAESTPTPPNPSLPTGSTALEPPQVCPAPVPVECRAEEMKVPLPDMETSRIPKLEPRELPTPKPPKGEREEVMDLPPGDSGIPKPPQREVDLPLADVVEEVVVPPQPLPKPIDVDNGDFSEIPVVDPGEVEIKVEEEQPTRKPRRGRPRRK